jgi:hypothetical protein
MKSAAADGLVDHILSGLLMRTALRRFGWLAALLSISCSFAYGRLRRQDEGSVLDAFKSARVVALGEGQHWNLPSHAFRLALIRHPDFATTVDDVVIEFGNSRYQTLLDRYISGDVVPDDSLKLVWQNTTAPNEVWDVPIYAEILRSVRDVNVRLPDRRLRVLAADPPVDWEAVKTKDDLMPWLAVRDSFAADLVAREVIAKRRRALLLFGDGHFWRHSDEPNLISHLDAAGIRSIVITTPTSTDLGSLDPRLKNQRLPVVLSLRQSPIGRRPGKAFLQLANLPASWDSIPMRHIADAAVFVAPPSQITFGWLTMQQCADSTYRRMRRERLSIVPWGRAEIARIERRCNAT